MNLTSFFSTTASRDDLDDLRNVVDLQDREIKRLSGDLEVLSDVVRSLVNRLETDQENSTRERLRADRAFQERIVQALPMCLEHDDCIANAQLGMACKKKKLDDQTKRDKKILEGARRRETDE